VYKKSLDAHAVIVIVVVVRDLELGVGEKEDGGLGCEL
jgi:hypothetical protein